MKHLITSLIILISVITTGQNSNEQNVGEFKELKVYDLIEVELIKSSENKVIISGQNTEDVLVTTKNGTLKIKMNLEKAYDGNKTKVKLYYTTIDIIDANEGADIHSKEVFKQYEIDLRAQEGGKINVKLDVTYANIKSVSGGYVKTEGIAKSQNVSILTGGAYKGELLKTEKTEVDIKAAGQAHIKATLQADIKIKAGGDVYVYGNPKTVNESKVFGGRVKYMD